MNTKHFKQFIAIALISSFSASHSFSATNVQTEIVPIEMISTDSPEIEVQNEQEAAEIVQTEVQEIQEAPVVQVETPAETEEAQDLEAPAEDVEVTITEEVQPLEPLTEDVEVIITEEAQSLESPTEEIKPENVSTEEPKPTCRRVNPLEQSVANLTQRVDELTTSLAPILNPVQVAPENQMGMFAMMLQMMSLFNQANRPLDQNARFPLAESNATGNSVASMASLLYATRMENLMDRFSQPTYGQFNTGPQYNYYTQQQMPNNFNSSNRQPALAFEQPLQLQLDTQSQPNWGGFTF